MIIPFCIVFAVIGWLHGMQYYITNLPTIANRIFSALFITALTSGLYISAVQNYTGYACLYFFAAFLLWIWPGAMSQFTDAIGNNPKVPRWKGLLEVTLRESLAIPMLAGLCWFTHHAYWPLIGAAFMGLPYYVAGYACGNNQRFVIVAPHAVKWAILGASIWFSIL